MAKIENETNLFRIVKTREECKEFQKEWGKKLGEWDHDSKLNSVLKKTR